MNDMSNGPRTAKVFWSGRSQAVRLPKEFRFDGDEVRIRREGNRVILESSADTVADAAADEIDRVRALVQGGVDSGPAVEWERDALRRFVRTGER